MWGITDDLSGAVVVRAPASLGSSIGRAPTNQTWSGVKVIIKWNTLSPQLPRVLPGCCNYLRQYQPLLPRPGVTSNLQQTASNSHSLLKIIKLSQICNNLLAARLMSIMLFLKFSAEEMDFTIIQ